MAPYCHEEICKPLFRLSEALLSRIPLTLPKVPCLGRPLPLPTSQALPILWSSGTPPLGTFPDCLRSQAPVGAPPQPPAISLLSSWGFEDCWGLFQSSGSRRTGTESRECERQLAAECDLLEGEGGETEGPPSGRGPLSPPWWVQTPKSTPAQEAGAQRPGEGSMQPSLVPLPPPVWSQPS